MGWVALVRQALAERAAALTPPAPTRPVVTADELATLVAPGRVAAVLGVDLLHLGPVDAAALVDRPPGLLVAGTQGLVVVDRGAPAARCGWAALTFARWAEMRPGPAAAAHGAGPARPPGDQAATGGPVPAAGRPLLALELGWQEAGTAPTRLLALAAGFDADRVGSTDRWFLAVEPHLPAGAALHRWSRAAEPASLLAALSAE